MHDTRVLVVGADVSPATHENRVTRARPLDYAGASGRLTLEAAAKLGRGWLLQPKHDGCYATVHLDAKGRIAAIRSRSCANFPAAATGALIGARVGWPHSVLVGELEWGTERATRVRLRQGARLLHLHDVVRSYRGEYVASYPYAYRRHALQGMFSEAVNLDPLVPWERDRIGRAKSGLTGRYVPRTVQGWRLVEVVEQIGADHFDDAWSIWGPNNDGEGIVAVNNHASMGARRSKLKVKLTETLDCVVVSATRHALRVSWRGHTFAIPALEHGCDVGDTVEVAHEGWYERQVMPRFARMVRQRADRS